MVRLGAMGDVIQTLPAAADLRSQFPAARITWAVDSRWEPLLQHNPDIDETVSVPLREWRRRGLGIASCQNAAALIGSLRAAEFDLAVDFQGLLKSAAIAALSRPKRVTGLSFQLLREPHAALLYTSHASTASPHVVDRYRELAALGIDRPVARKASFPLPHGEPRSGLPDRFVLASPQAGWGSKQWPAEHYSALASMLWQKRGIPLLADCAPGQDGYAASIRDNAAEGAVIIHPSTIPQLIAATRRAAAVVGVDSGPLHLAAAIGKPGVAIFGPTDPGRNGPYGSEITVIRDQSAETSYKRGTEPSPSMRACYPDLVFRRLNALLNSLD